MASLFVDIDGAELEVAEDATFRIADEASPEIAPVIHRVDASTYHVLHDGRSSVIYVEDAGDGMLRIQSRGQASVAHVQTHKERLLARYGVNADSRTGDGTVKAPMPGLVLRLMVDVGDEVNQGQGVLVLEAMKMENELVAPAHGKITAIHASVGEAVGKNALLVEIEATK